MDQPSKLLIELIQNACQKVIQSKVVEVNKVSELMINKDNVEELLYRRSHCWFMHQIAPQTYFRINAQLRALHGGSLLGNSLVSPPPPRGGGTHIWK